MKQGLSRFFVASSLAIALGLAACGRSTLPPAGPGGAGAGREGADGDAADSTGREGPPDQASPFPGRRYAESPRGEPHAAWEGAPRGVGATEDLPGSEATAPHPSEKSADKSAPNLDYGDRPQRRAWDLDRDRSRRQGLATHWGEDRRSSVRSVFFEREDPVEPFELTRIFYNDEDGIRAMTRHRPTPGCGPRSYGALSVRLLDAWQRPLPCSNDGSAAYVVGEPGDRYIIRIDNRSGSRVEAVATVDGLDVIDGKPGSYFKRGYLIDAYGSLDIEGFRRSEDEVATFRFGSVSGSYAASKGDTRNVGVIGVAFFQEEGWPEPRPHQEVTRRRGADPFPNRYAEPPWGS